MRHHLKKLGGLAAVLAFGSITGYAQQSGLNFALNLRTGYQFGAQKDHLTSRTLGFGLEASYAIPKVRFAVELGYMSKPGDQYDAGTEGLAFPTSVNLPTTPVTTGTPVLSQNGDWGLFTGDQRRNSLEGLTLRVSAMTNFAGPWSFGGGLQIGGKYKQEVAGNSYGYYVDNAGAPISDPNSSTGNAEFFDSYITTPVKSKLSISPFLTASYALNEMNTVSLSVVGLRYTGINYIHVVGTVDARVDGYGGHTDSDYIVEKSRMIPHIELSYAFRF